MHLIPNALLLPSEVRILREYYGHVAGESVVVARGGRGGMGVLRPTKQDHARMQQRKSRFLVSAYSVPVLVSLQLA